METQTTSLSVRTAEPLDARRWLMLAAVLGATLMAGFDTFIVNITLLSLGPFFFVHLLEPRKEEAKSTSRER